MDKFGLKNFRRFENQIDVNLGKINLLVGKNNSGKSSFIKGFVLMMDNLKHLRMGRDDEGKNIFSDMPLLHSYLESDLDLYLGNINYMKSISSKNEDIVFSYTFTPEKEDELTIRLTVVPSKHKTKGKLSEIFISSKSISILFRPDVPIKGGAFGTASVNVNNKNYPMIIDGSFIAEVQPYVFTQIIINVWNKFKEQYGDNAVLTDVTKRMENLAVKLQDFISYVEPYYIPSFFATHEYKYKKDSYHYNVIRDFQLSRIVEGDIENRFILDMMKEFEIGNDYMITLDSDMAEIDIIDEQDNKMPLPFKGTGSVRLFFILLILATCLRKQEQSHIIPILTIEEPEQNLHPMLQSKLAYLFSDFSKLSHPQTKLFIETHSEYLIRKTQVMARRFCKNGNPINDFDFKTYYFPSSDDFKRKPYDMRYCEDGRFYERFGFGFFDEAAELAMQIL